MDLDRFHLLAARYASLRVAVLGDFCLDRYLEIDPEKKEISIETGLPVHNVVNVRAQPGGAGTILNNLCALGIGTIFPLGFAGDDGEGFELCRALEARPGVRLDHFIRTAERRTFTYCKPLVIAPGKSPVELNRLDSKNWTPTSESLKERISSHFEQIARSIDAVIVLDQVDIPETGVVTSTLLKKIFTVQNPKLLILADSRRGLSGFPPVTFKMNAAELSVLTQSPKELTLEEIKAQAAALARKNQQSVFVTLAERGIVGANARGEVEHVPALPLRGEIDVVGAGDAVSASLASSLAAGATLRDALELANAAASVVIHKLGTTGTASLEEIAKLLPLA
ncbi:MAG TPA: PfkB family carbohydrate kinase [Candidatus Limnocylindrales bacterium]|jgi:rfaE bifunctional protein kinase chain/domain|nr:PfkB family carbohydrate kinase [Candidatus Limnocylindrales bacterium]